MPVMHVFLQLVTTYTLAVILLIFLFRYACALEEKLASLETSAETKAKTMQQQVTQMHSRHIQELELKERYACWNSQRVTRGRYLLHTYYSGR